MEKGNSKIIHRCKSCKKELQIEEDICPYCGRRQSKSKFYYLGIDIKNFLISNKKLLFTFASILVTLLIVYIVVISINSPRTVTRKFFREFNDDNLKGVASCLYEEDTYLCTQYIINYHEKYDSAREQFENVKLRRFKLLRKKYANAVGEVHFVVKIEEAGKIVEKEYEEVVFFTRRNGKWYFQFYPMYDYTTEISPSLSNDNN